MERVRTAIATKVMGPSERAEFERMMDTYPEVVELFTLSRDGFTFWFGEKALIHPRTWDTSSPDGRNTIRVPFSVFEEVVPRHREVVKAVSASTTVK